MKLCLTTIMVMTLMSMPKAAETAQMMRRVWWVSTFAVLLSLLAMIARRIRLFAPANLIFSPTEFINYVTGLRKRMAVMHIYRTTAPSLPYYLF